jgi:hypothetical protein
MEYFQMLILKNNKILKKSVFYLDFGKRGCFIGTLICFLLIGVTYFYLNKDGKKLIVL